MNTRKLILVEYDEESNEVESNCLVENGELLDFIKFPTQKPLVGDRYLLDKHDRNRFTMEQWEIIENSGSYSPVDRYGATEDVIDGNGGVRLSYSKHIFSHATLNAEMVAFWDMFFSSCEEKQQFIIGLYCDEMDRNHPLFYYQKV